MAETIFYICVCLLCLSGFVLAVTFAVWLFHDMRHDK